MQPGIQSGSCTPSGSSTTTGASSSSSDPSKSVTICGAQEQSVGSLSSATGVLARRSGPGILTAARMLIHANLECTAVHAAPIVPVDRRFAQAPSHGPTQLAAPTCTPHPSVRCRTPLTAAACGMGRAADVGMTWVACHDTTCRFCPLTGRMCAPVTHLQAQVNSSAPHMQASPPSSPAPFPPL